MKTSLPTGMLLGLGVAFATIAHAQTPSPVTGIDTNLLRELRITMPGQEDTLPSTESSRVLVAPRLAIRTSTNQTDQVSQDVIPLLQGSPSPEASRHMARALSLMSSNQVFLASRELWQASRGAPGQPAPASGLALMYLLAEDNDRAANLLERLAADHPRDADVVFNLAAARYGQHRFAEASSLLQSILATDRYPATIHYNLGLCLAAEGRLDPALQELEHAHQRAPRNPAARVAMARVEASRGRLRECVQHLTAAAPILGREGLRDVLLDPAFRTASRDPGLLAFLRGESTP